MLRRSKPSKNEMDFFQGSLTLFSISTGLRGGGRGGDDRRPSTHTGKDKRIPNVSYPEWDEDQRPNFRAMESSTFLHNTAALICIISERSK